MIESSARDAVEFGPVGKSLFAVSKSLALVGGIVLLAIIGLSIVSIVGRKIASAPVLGDVEIMQMSAAPAIACFFAYCHLIRGDVRVDFVSDQLGQVWRMRLNALGSLCLGVVAALIAWRTAVGAEGLHEVGETSALLSWPIWVSQALVVPGFALQAVSGFYMFARYLSAAKERTA